MDKAFGGGESSRRSSDHRDSPRFEVDLPATVKISRTVMTQPFQMKDATVREVARSGARFSLIIEAGATREELTKILSRRRGCSTLCQYPGAEQPSWVFGEITFVEPRVTSQGVKVRFGVLLDESKPEGLADLKAFLKTLEEQSGTPAPDRG